MSLIKKKDSKHGRKIPISDKFGIIKFINFQLKIFVISYKAFVRDKCTIHATELTYFSFLSIVPLFAMFFGIAKGFGFENILEKQLLTNFPGQEEIVSKIAGFAHSYLDNTKGGIIAFLGIIILLYTIIKVLGHVESSFNHIWNLKKSRNLIRKFTDYLTIVVLSPILMILSSSITIFISSHMLSILQKNQILEMITPLVQHFFKFTPFIIIWILFTLIFIIIPNTKVKFTSAMYAAFISGSLFQLVQWAFFKFQFGVTKYNAIYGSFSIIPLFLIMIQISWQIVLFGAEINFSFQNIKRDFIPFDNDKISNFDRKIIILQIMHLFTRNFINDGKLFTIERLNEKIKFPYHLTESLISFLVELNLLNLVMIDDEMKYQIAINPDKLSINYILRKLDHDGEGKISLRNSDEISLFQKKLTIFESLIENSDANVLLKNI